MELRNLTDLWIVYMYKDTFWFDSNYYKQTKSTAMGTKFAPVYETLTIGYLEEKLYELVKARFGDDFWNYFVNNRKRFFDDCFIPWTKSIKDLETLHAILNNLHKYIKFTLQ